MFFIVLGQHVSILIESYSGPSKKTDNSILTFLSKDLYLRGAWRWFYKNRNTIQYNKEHNKYLLCLTDASLYILYTC